MTDIALGFGNNIDYEIAWDSAVFQNLIREYNIHAAELDVNRVIQSERDLVISILAFLQRASGGERFVASSDVIEQFSQRFAKQVTLGGTSVRAAIAMHKLGYTAALHLVTINDHVRRLLPPDTFYVCSSAQDSAYPHLIVQFARDTHISAGDIDICTRQANRLIYHSDTDNIDMKLNEAFAEHLTDAKVLLVSGFNAMQDRDLLANRLESVLRMMQSLPNDAVVFCEDAGFYDDSMRQLVYHTLAKRMSILSLNEDELQGYVNAKLDLLDVQQVSEALGRLKQQFPIPIMVVHTQFWALAYGADAQRLSAALKSGVAMATTRYCYGDDFTLEDYNAVAALAPKRETADFAAALNQRDYNICCVPVAHVEPPIATTIGLGDAFVGGFLPALLGS
jgi:ADP-dependent phosphofructokinase/glucokinase